MKLIPQVPRGRGHRVVLAMWAALALLLLTTAMPAVAQDDGTIPGVRVPDRYLWNTAYGLLPDGSTGIPYCVVNGDQPHVTNLVLDELELAMEAWETFVKVRFVRLSGTKCTATQNQRVATNASTGGLNTHVAIFVRNDYLPIGASAVGRFGTTVSQYGATMELPLPEAATEECAHYVPNGDLTLCSRTTYVHEFGHVLGLQHAHWHPDAEAESCKDSIPNDANSRQAMDDLGLLEISGDYDRYSILNYCRETHSNLEDAATIVALDRNTAVRTGRELDDLRTISFTPLPSYGDIATAAGIYGSPYPKCGGLYPNRAMGADSRYRIGTHAPDVFEGTSGADTISGGLGIDRICGRGGADTIYGGGGSDRIYAGGGDDTVWGGSGADWIWGSDGSDTIHGQGGQDRIYGEAGNDFLRGNQQSDVMHGGADNDDLRGHDGKDNLQGGSGDDRLYGHGNSDTLDGGPGYDINNGGTGYDTCSELNGEVFVSCERRPNG